MTMKSSYGNLLEVVRAQKAKKDPKTLLTALLKAQGDDEANSLTDDGNDQDLFLPSLFPLFSELNPSLRMERDCLISLSILCTSLLLPYSHLEVTPMPSIEVCEQHEAWTQCLLTVVLPKLILPAHNFLLSKLFRVFSALVRTGKLSPSQVRDVWHTGLKQPWDKGEDWMTCRNQEDILLVQSQLALLTSVFPVCFSFMTVPNLITLLYKQLMEAQTTEELSDSIFPFFLVAAQVIPESLKQVWFQNKNDELKHKSARFVRAYYRVLVDIPTCPVFLFQTGVRDGRLPVSVFVCGILRQLDLKEQSVWVDVVFALNQALISQPLDVVLVHTACQAIVHLSQQCTHGGQSLLFSLSRPLQRLIGSGHDYTVVSVALAWIAKPSLALACKLEKSHGVLCALLQRALMFPSSTSLTECILAFLDQCTTPPYEQLCAHTALYWNKLIDNKNSTVWLVPLLNWARQRDYSPWELSLLHVVMETHTSRDSAIAVMMCVERSACLSSSPRVRELARDVLDMIS